MNNFSKLGLAGILGFGLLASGCRNIDKSGMFLDNRPKNGNVNGFAQFTMAEARHIDGDMKNFSYDLNEKSVKGKDEEMSGLEYAVEIAEIMEREESLGYNSSKKIKQDNLDNYELNSKEARIKFWSGIMNGILTRTLYNVTRKEGVVEQNTEYDVITRDFNVRGIFFGKVKAFRKDGMKLLQIRVSDWSDRHEPREFVLYDGYGKESYGWLDGVIDTEDELVSESNNGIYYSESVNMTKDQKYSLMGQTSELILKSWANETLDLKAHKDRN